MCFIGERIIACDESKVFSINLNLKPFESYELHDLGNCGEIYNFIDQDHVLVKRQVDNDSIAFSVLSVINVINQEVKCSFDITDDLLIQAFKNVIILWNPNTKYFKVCLINRMNGNEYQIQQISIIPFDFIPQNECFFKCYPLTSDLYQFIITAYDPIKYSIKVNKYMLDETASQVDLIKQLEVHSFDLKLRERQLEDSNFFWCITHSNNFFVYVSVVDKKFDDQKLAFKLNLINSETKEIVHESSKFDYLSCDDFEAYILELRNHDDFILYGSYSDCIIHFHVIKINSNYKLYQNRIKINTSKCEKSFKLLNHKLLFIQSKNEKLVYDVNAMNIIYSIETTDCFKVICKYLRPNHLIVADRAITKTIKLINLNANNQQYVLLTLPVEFEFKEETISCNDKYICVKLQESNELLTFLLNN